MIVGLGVALLLAGALGMVRASFRWWHRDWLRQLRQQGAPSGLRWWQGWI